MSIESKHGVDEPGYVPPQTTAEKLEGTGAKLQSAGKQMSSLGGSLVKLGCSGFFLLVVIRIAIGALSSTHSDPSSAAIATTEEEHTTSSAEPAPELKIGSTVTLKGEQSGEQVEATLLAYRESIPVGEYDTPQSGMKFVGVTLKLKNTGSVLYSDSPSNGAVILTSTGRQAKTAIVTGGDCAEGFSESVKIAAGESQEGCIAFELPEGATAAKLQWTPSNGYSEETAEWSLSSAPAPGEAPRLKVGGGTDTGATPCGEELYGSQDTTCPFAHEVLKAFVAEYAIKSVPPAKVSATSPVTHKTYNLNCEIVSENTTVECDTGTATVSFPLNEAEKYKAEEEGSG